MAPPATSTLVERPTTADGAPEAEVRRGRVRKDTERDPEDERARTRCQTDRISGSNARRTAAELDELDDLAHRSAHDPVALDTLLRRIDDDRLADPAIRRLLLDEDRIADVRQDVLIAVAASVATFRGEARFTTWLHTLARNTTIGHLRSIRTDETALEEWMSPSARMSSMIAAQEAVRAIVRELPERYRRAVELRDIDGRSYDEVAATLGVKLNTARSLIARGRGLVAAAVESGGLRG